MDGELIVIEPPRGWRGLGLRELAGARELLGFLMWREIRVRYAHTTLGVLWTVLQPLATMALFTVVFARLGGVASDGVPYPLFALVGLVTWTYVSSAISGAADSLIANPTLVTRVYFPRLVIPLAPVGAGLLDLAVAGVLLVFALAWYGIMPSLARVWLIIPATALLVVATAGLGILLSAINLRFRDARYTIPFALQLWFFASPIAWSTASLPDRWRSLFAINPLSGIIEAYRAALLPAAPLDPSHLAGAAVVSVLLLVGGVSYFRRAERSFADIA
ncbi:MAG: ABC transporter permease [Gemmatimonadaceae bacterium]